MKCRNFKTESRVKAATFGELDAFTRDTLREFCRRYGIPQGRNKIDTIRNIMASGPVTVTVTLNF